MSVIYFAKDDAGLLSERLSEKISPNVPDPTIPATNMINPCKSYLSKFFSYYNLAIFGELSYTAYIFC
jgi:hypothetical protein